MRFSHFIASMMLPHAVEVNVGPWGTRGTQLAPPGTGAVPVEVYVGARLAESALVVTGQGPRTRAKVPLAVMRSERLSSRS